MTMRLNPSCLSAIALRLTCGLGVLLGVLLTGCVHTPTSPVHFYTLTDATQYPPAVTSKTDAAYIDILPIQLPERFKRPQFVINLANSAEIKVLEQARWSTAFNDELRDALKSAINRDAHATVSPRLAGDAPAYRVALSITQLSAILDDHIRATATLTLAARNSTSAADHPPLVCELGLQQAIGGDTTALVAGYRTLVDTLAAYILNNIQILATSAAPTCASLVGSAGESSH